MFHAPIHGSQINLPAKLYKRFTPTETVIMDDTVITHENNYYRTHFSFAWVEADDEQGGVEQPISGLINSNTHMTIKLNSGWKRTKGDLASPDAGDIITIGKERWIVEESGSQRVRIKSMRDLAVVYLPLRRVL